MKKIASTDKAPKAIGPYSQATIDPKSGLVFTSGQIAMDAKTGELVGNDASSQAEQVMNNLKAVLEAAGSSLDNALKATVYLKNLDDFTAVNDVYARYFTGYPSRATVEVSRLPKGALVEIEIVAFL